MTREVVRTNSVIRGRLLSGIGHRFVSTAVDALAVLENKEQQLQSLWKLLKVFKTSVVERYFNFYKTELDEDWISIDWLSKA